MFYGLLDLSFWEYIGITLLFTHLTIASVTIFLHRAQAHRALTLHPLISHCFRLWLWLTTGMETKAWASIHRKHHAKCEREDDPHSPQVLGITTVLLEGAELYKREAQNQETRERYGDGTPDDWLERNVYTPHSAQGIFIMLFLNILLLGVPGIIVWAVQMAWIPFFAAGVINGVGHYWGYRNFDAEDASTNISPWGILIGGEELHNNHHAYPTSAKLSNKWWEFDIGWLYIQILSTFGLAKVKRVAPKSRVVSGRREIDLASVLANRVEVMTLYSKSVIAPLFKQVARQSTSADQCFLNRIKPHLLGPGLLCDESKKILDDRTQVLSAVYSFKEQLKSIWGRTTATQKELMDALNEWCHQAEQTGIKRLEEFVAYLRGYTLT